MGFPMENQQLFWNDTKQCINIAFWISMDWSLRVFIKTYSDVKGMVTIHDDVAMNK